MSADLARKDEPPRVDALFALELDIARKADELARERGVADGWNLQCWLQAEAEILAARRREQLPAVD